MIKTVPIKKNFEFLRAYKKGRYYAGRYLVLYALKNGSKTNRLGITVSRKIGKSVRRNRLKRLVRENYRFYEEFVADGVDLVFVVRSTEEMPGFFEVKSEMKFLFKRLGIFDQEKWNCLKNC